MEKVEFKPPTKVTALYALYRVVAIEAVVAEMGITTYKKKQDAGEKYHKDNRVPENMAYIEVDPEEKRDEFWQKVDTIAPPPTSDDILTRKLPH